MRMLILLAGAAAMATSLPALAKPGNGHGNGHGNPHAGMVHGNPHGAMVHAKARSRMAANGGRYGANSCPPGLAKKGNGCLPPGQAKKLYRVGQRLPTGYRNYSAYDAIPSQYRDLVPYNDASRYIYRDNTVYTVDPRTNLVTRVIDLLRR